MINKHKKLNKRNKIQILHKINQNKRKLNNKHHKIKNFYNNKIQHKFSNYNKIKQQKPKIKLKNNYDLFMFINYFHKFLIYLSVK